MAVSAVVVPSSEEVPEPSVAEPMADRDRASSGAADEAVGDDGGGSTVGPPGSKSGKRRKTKKRRVQHDLTYPVPLVSESEHSSSPPRKLAGSGGKSTLGPPAVPEDHPEEATTFWCRSCRGDARLFPFVAAGSRCRRGGDLVVYDGSFQLLGPAIVVVPKGGRARH